MKYIRSIFCLGVALAIAPLSHATSVSGTIVTNAAVTTSGTDNAYLNFTNPGSVGTGQFAPTGTFKGFGGDAVTFNDFDYETVSTPFLLYSGTDSTVGAFSFTITNISTCAFSGTSYFTCAGTGTMAENGYTSASTTFYLGENQSGNINFSDTNTTAATPEPSSLVLLGSGLVGAAGMVLRRRRAV